jgi:hypothetical protein
LDLDPEKSLEDQLHSTVDEIKHASDAIAPIEDSNPNAPSHTKVDDVPIRNDPRFAKYFTMLKMVNHKTSDLRASFLTCIRSSDNHV